MAEEKAYVGYRSAGRRPESRQDRRAAADAPLSALRGAVSGVLGAPGDIESLIRMLPGLSERTVLPTSEDVEKRLPLPELNRTPTGRAFTTAGQLGGGFYGGPGSPLRAVAALPSAVSRAGRDFLMSSSPVNVIKPKGGNWLAGSVERAVDPMRAYLPSEEMIREAGMNPDVPARHASLAMNRWLEQKLSKYIKNEMATPEDPLRALAERGVTHAEPRAYGPGTTEDLRHIREMEGFPAAGLGQSEAAKAWEAAADMAVVPGNVGQYRAAWSAEHPWFEKATSDTSIYAPSERAVREDLGFDHLVDELRNAVNPESGLPANLRWKYADLDKVTVPQAVQRVADINEWRAAQKAEADLARARNPATFTHKEYPEQGMSWVELRQPEKPKNVTLSELTESQRDEIRRAAEDEAWTLKDSGDRREIEDIYDEVQNRLLKETPGAHTYDADTALADALKYEGETMGHCVGGYCPDVLEGRSKIYSLRDKKGQPHVTIEVAPGRKLTEKDLPDDVRELLSEQYGDASREEFEAAVQQYVKQQAVPDEIVQIKGKGNKAPKEDYLPAVQDFVRSGQWGRVGDLGNTGLIDVTQAGPLMKALQDIYGRNMGVGMDKFNAAAESTPDAQRFMTKDELLKFLGETPPEAKARGGSVHGYPTPDAEGFASGGLVEYNPAKIQSLVDTLREEMYG